jgi:hypothetical protein
MFIVLEFDFAPQEISFALSWGKRREPSLQINLEVTTTFGHQNQIAKPPFFLTHLTQISTKSFLGSLTYFLYLFPCQKNTTQGLPRKFQDKF